MAKVWFCYEGPEPTKGEANAERPLVELVELLRLTQDKYLGQEVAKVRFNPGNTLGKIAGYKHVVVEVEKTEARAAGWKAGYYYSPLTPEEATKKLGLSYSAR